jgi:hypothetical protein
VFALAGLARIDAPAAHVDPRANGKREGNGAHADAAVAAR